MKPRAKSRWSPASSEPANSLPILNAARPPRESGTPLRIPGLLFRRLAIASFTVWTITALLFAILFLQSL